MRLIIFFQGFFGTQQHILISIIPSKINDYLLSSRVRIYAKQDREPKLEEEKVVYKWFVKI